MKATPTAPVDGRRQDPGPGVHLAFDAGALAWTALPALRQIVGPPVHDRVSRLSPAFPQSMRIG